MMSVALRSFTLSLVLTAWVTSGLCAGPVPPVNQRLHLSGQVFGTSYSIKLASPSDTVSRDEVSGRVVALFEEIDRQMSLWREDSELSQFNSSASTDWFPTSAETARAVAVAVDVSRVTKGAFDPTVAPLVQLWGFGAQQQPVRLPSDEEIAEARQHVGIELIEVRRAPPAIRKHDPNVKLDLNAIAKGDAVDRVAALLDEYAGIGYLVEIGGEVRTSGTREDSSPWGIGIEQPLAGQRAVQTIVDLTDAALATSGDYRNYIEADGKRFSHTIDPRTGRPIDHTLAAVSVVADDCMTADAWATALMVLGPDEGSRSAEANGIAALFLVHDGSGFVVTQTTNFPSTRTPQTNAARSNALSTFLLAAVVFGVAIAGMAIGVIVSNRRLRGSCGGLEGLKDAQGNPLCDACTQPTAECEQFREQIAAASQKPPASP